MNKEHIRQKLISISLSLFRKDFFGLYHGSISAKTEQNRFIINTKEAVFDSLSQESLIELNYKKDYRWSEASIDTEIHHSIYSQILNAKFITFTLPPFTTAYSLNHSVIIPKDYFGHTTLGSIEIIDPKKFDDWYDRAISEIPQLFISKKTDMLVIRGYGIYAYNKDLFEMVKKIAILERSVRLLLLDNN